VGGTSHGHAGGGLHKAVLHFVRQLVPNLLQREREREDTNGVALTLCVGGKELLNEHI
jgi:hypothetical protein